MKTAIANFCLALLAVFAVSDCIHDWMANDASHYFATHPPTLVLAAWIGITGGLAFFILNRFPVRWQRYIKLFTLATSAMLVMIGGVWISCVMAGLPQVPNASDGSHQWLELLAMVIGTDTVLGLEFYRIWNRRP